MRDFLKLSGMLALLIVLGTSCNKDGEPCGDPANPQCANYDPCFGKYPTADFKIRQISPGFVIPENLQAEWCDTILLSGVELLAEMERAWSYTWQIGSESEPCFGRRIVMSFSS
jgi:hypothetical protein